MAHQDGRCAAVAETIYVQNDTTTCSDSATTDLGFGTAMKPLCSMQPVPGLLSGTSGTKDLVVIRGTVQSGTWTFTGQGGGELSLVGQSNALLAGGASPAFAMSTGSAFMRDLKMSSSGSDGIDERGGTLALQNLTIAGSATSGVGISATGGTLTTSKVTVDSCVGGGILLDGAAFDIENTTVTNNGPGQQPIVWGGVLVNSLPANGSKLLHLVTIKNNNATGLACASTAAIQGDGVFASGNSSVQIQTTCAVAGCSPMSQTCGAQ